MKRRDYDTISRILLHSFLVLAGFQVLTVVMLVGFSDLVYWAHSGWFPISREAFTIAGYAFLGLMKITSICLFLIPWIAMRLNAHRVRE